MSGMLKTRASHQQKNVRLMKNQISEYVYFKLMQHNEIFTQHSEQVCALFAWLISHQPAVLFSQNKPATSNQPAVPFSQNKPAPAISHQPTEQADD
jgi:hypothetical protein